MEENTIKEEKLTLSQAKEKYNCRKAFEILINDKPYQVWSIDGYEHQNGKWNGTPATWWLDYGKNGNQEEERELLPFVDKGVHRICWEISYKQSNSTKVKWDELRISSRGICKIYANGKHIYSFNSHDLGFAMSKAQYLTVILSEHPYDFFNQEKEDGRKIWYYGLPATIKPSTAYPGEISIYPDYTEVDEDAWWNIYEDRDKNVVESKDDDDLFGLDDDRRAENKSSGSINHGDALWDGKINWFRK